ncbi:HAMP domain-containing protein, partial [Methylobacterium sp. E-041]|uniref:HAMP domain-containing protein n=1 Tax=Methylobacterium sp. E-041 TaxID=2836573 RepID=UPI001FB95E5F
FDTLREKLAVIETKQDDARNALNDRVAEAQRTAFLTLWGAALITLLIRIGLGMAINRVIVRPLGRVMTFVEHVGEGDLTGTLGEGGHNEIGRLKRTLNAMVAGL